MAISLSKNIAQCDDRARPRDDRAAVGWAWTGRNLILDEALMLGRMNGARRRGRPRQRWLDTLMGYSSGATISNMRRYARDRAGWRGAATDVVRSRMRLDGTRYLTIITNYLKIITKIVKLGGYGFYISAQIISPLAGFGFADLGLIASEAQVVHSIIFASSRLFHFYSRGVARLVSDNGLISESEWFWKENWRMKVRIKVV